MFRFLVCLLFISSSYASVDMIKVNGSSTVQVKPDTVVINFAMITKNKSSLKAQAENSKVVKNVINGLKTKFKILSKNIQTKNYSLRPKYSYPRNKPPVYTGVEIENRVLIKFNIKKNTSKILDYLTSQGISNISNIQFSVLNNEKLHKEALKLAFENAKMKALVLAKKSGTSLGKVLSIVESSQHSPTPRYSMMEKSVSSAPVIEGGTVGVSANLDVSFEIK